MFDVNLLNKPGIQKIDSFVETKESKKVTPLRKKQSPINKNIDITYKRSYKNVIVIFLFFLILSFVLVLNSRSTEESIEKADFAVSYLLNMVNVDYDNINLKSIICNNEKIDIIIELKNENSLYEKMEFFKGFNYNVWGASIYGENSIYIRESRQLKNDNLWDLKKIQSYLKNVKGIEYELLNDKIIIVSNYNELISFIELLEEKNIINHYLIDVSQIKDASSNNYYKLIIKNYD